MLIDLIQIPNRYSDYDDSFSTMLPCFKYRDCVDDITCYGRKIDLDPFNSDMVFKYKAIEFEDNTIVEKLLLIDEEIDTNKKFWTSGRMVYPIQVKRFSYADPMGQSFKCVNGIAEFCRIHFNDIPLMPAAYAVKRHHNIHPLWNYIVPQTDIGIVSHGYSRMVNNIQNVRGVDQWVEPQRKLNNIFSSPGVDFRCHAGEFARDITEYPFDAGSELRNTDCINYDWNMYELITRLNDLGISDVRIEADARVNHLDIAFSSRYSGFYDYKHFPAYQSVVTTLERLFKATMKSRFGEVPWIHIVIEKLWTEEIFITIDVECPGRSSAITTYYYIDLFVFILGTVGMIHSTIKE